MGYTYLLCNDILLTWGLPGSSFLSFTVTSSSYACCSVHNQTTSIILLHSYIDESHLARQLLHFTPTPALLIKNNYISTLFLNYNPPTFSRQVRYVPLGQHCSITSLLPARFYDDIFSAFIADTDFNSYNF
jgi:hypothetical protein